MPDYHVLIDYDNGYWDAVGIEGLEMPRYQVPDSGRAGYNRLVEEVPTRATVAARHVGQVQIHFHHTNAARRALDAAASH